MHRARDGGGCRAPVPSLHAPSDSASLVHWLGNWTLSFRGFYRAPLHTRLIKWMGDELNQWPLSSPEVGGLGWKFPLIMPWSFWCPSPSWPNLGAHQEMTQNKRGSCHPHIPWDLGALCQVPGTKTKYIVFTVSQQGYLLQNRRPPLPNMANIKTPWKVRLTTCQLPRSL